MKFRRIRAGPAGDWDSESGDRPGPSAAGRRPPAASVMMGRRFKTDFNSNRNVSLGLLSELSGDVKGWQSKSSAEFKRSELAILLSAESEAEPPRHNFNFPGKVVQISHGFCATGPGSGLMVRTPILSS